MTRRLLGAVGAAAAVVALAVPAAAQERIGSGEWTGSHVERPPTVTTDPGSATVQGVFQRDRAYPPPRVTVTVAPPEGLPAGCPHDAPRSGDAVVTANDDGISPASWGFSWVAPFGPGACNGTYTVNIVGDVLGADDPQLTTSIDVAVAPPPVNDVVAQARPDRTVEVSWTPTGNRTPDFLGYHVIRTSSAGDVVQFPVDDPDASSFTDEELPAEGGTFEYRVVGRRAGPGGEVTSSGGDADEPVDVEPAPEPDPGDDDGDGDGDGDDAAGAGSGSTSTSGPGRSTLSGRVSSGSSRVSPPATGPRTTLDTGYDELLPFGDREPGAEDAVLPTGDETASMIYEDLPGRGLVIPVATGLVLAVWAFHLRYLARAARPPA